jgi:hypothetical protein
MMLADFKLVTNCCRIFISMFPIKPQHQCHRPRAPPRVEGGGSTAPECLELFRTSLACTRYSVIYLDTN